MYPQWVSQSPKDSAHRRENELKGGSMNFVSASTGLVDILKRACSSVLAVTSSESCIAQITAHRVATS